MPTYITLVDYTDQGIARFQETTERADALTAVARNLGAKVKDVYWTMGAHDGVLIFEAADDATAAALMYSISGKGFVRTHTLRAFSRQEIESIIAKAP